MTVEGFDELACLNVPDSDGFVVGSRADVVVVGGEGEVGDSEVVADEGLD